MCGLFVLSATKASSLNVISFAKKKDYYGKYDFNKLTLTLSSIIGLNKIDSTNKFLFKIHEIMNFRSIFIVVFFCKLYNLSH